MNRHKLGIGILVTILVILLVVLAGMVTMIALDRVPPESVQSEQTPIAAPTTTPTVSPEGTPPLAVEDSRDGAIALKRTLNENGHEDKNVTIRRNGEVIVSFTSDAQHGPELKQELTEVALLYPEVVAEHQEMGGLVVYANGVALVVSKDTALAHARGDIKESAYKETFHYQSVNE